MKNIAILFAFFLFTGTVVLAQQVIPLPVSFSGQRNVFPPNFGEPKHSPGENKAAASLIDSLFLVIDTLKMKLYDDSVEANTDRVFIYGAASTDALDFKQFSAAGSISAGFKFWKDNMFLNASVNVGAKVEQQNSDSVSVNELYFPDVANAAAAGGIEVRAFETIKYFKYRNQAPKERALRIAEDQRKVENHELVLRADVSLQNKSIKKDSTVYKLGMFNYDIGLQYRWRYTTKNNRSANFAIAGFYNSILISDNSQANFNLIFNDYTAPVSLIQPRFKGFSTLFSFQVNDTYFYIRTYTDFKRSGDLAFSVGLKQAIKFATF